MYCVRCGVKLQDGVERCPLCDTPVHNPDEKCGCGCQNYSDTLPPAGNPVDWVSIGVATLMMALAAILCLVVDLRYTGVGTSWSGTAMLGIALAWVVVILPRMFRNPNPVVFVPTSFAALEGYLLYICLHNGGHWFLGFAFPVTGIMCILSETLIVLLRYIKGGRLFIAGGTLIAFGSSLMLVEFFEHITFGHRMFTWSLFGVSVFGLAGLFTILVAIVPTLKAFMERKTFL